MGASEGCAASCDPPHRHRHCLARPARSCSAQLGSQGPSTCWELHEQPIAPSVVLHPANDPTIHIPLFQSLYITASRPALALAVAPKATLPYLHSPTATATAVLRLAPLPARHSASSTSSTRAGITPSLRRATPRGITGHAHAKTGHNRPLTVPLPIHTRQLSSRVRVLFLFLALDEHGYGRGRVETPWYVFVCCTAMPRQT